jgi:uncharacterized protein (DUF1778 family)
VKFRSIEYDWVMSTTTAKVSLSLRPETVKAVDAAAQGQRRSRSQTVDLILEHALTGESRLSALEQISRRTMQRDDDRRKAPSKIGRNRDS